MNATVVFTDLDGTLLDPVTYSPESARPALDYLKSESVPLIFVTSKTRTEVEALRRSLANDHPFIVENGGAAFIPENYFPFDLAQAKRRRGMIVMEWGRPYGELVTGLHAASRESGCEVRGFHDMTAGELAEACGFSLEEAALAKVREYGEPFLIPDAGCAPAFLSALSNAGFRWTRGGRFYHVSGNNDKAQAVKELLSLYRRVNPRVRSVGLGDGPNDAAFLQVVDNPVVIRSAFLDDLKCQVPHFYVPEAEGPAGWSEAILALLGPKGGSQHLML